VAALPDEADILLQIWREQRDKARQCEDQRALMTNIVLVLASAGIGLVVQHGLRDRTMLLVTVSLVLLGGYGAITSLKYRERYAYHNAQARVLLHRLDGMYPALHLEWDRANAIKRHSERKGYAKLYRLRLGQLWMGLHAAIAIIGVALTVAIASQA
jgi:hypothetical protein